MFATTLLLPLLIGLVGANSDSRVKAAPALLWKTVQAGYPAFRLSSITDLSDDERRLFDSEGTGSCPGLARGRFFGGPEDSFVLLLRARKEAVVIVARPENRHWRLFELQRIPDGFVSAVFAEPPGEFQDAGTGKRYSSRTPAVHVVKYESTSVIFIWKDSRFQPVFLKD